MKTPSSPLQGRARKSSVKWPRKSAASIRPSRTKAKACVIRTNTSNGKKERRSNKDFEFNDLEFPIWTGDFGLRVRLFWSAAPPRRFGIRAHRGEYTQSL